MRHKISMCILLGRRGNECASTCCYFCDKRDVCGSIFATPSGGCMAAKVPDIIKAIHMSNHPKEETSCSVWCKNKIQGLEP